MVLLFSVWSADMERAALCLFCLPLLQQHRNCPCLLTLPFKDRLSCTASDWAQKETLPSERRLKMAETGESWALSPLCQAELMSLRLFPAVQDCLGPDGFTILSFGGSSFTPPALCCFSSPMERSRHARQKELQKRSVLNPTPDGQSQPGQVPAIQSLLLAKPIPSPYTCFAPPRFIV